MSFAVTSIPNVSCTRTRPDTPNADYNRTQGGLYSYHARSSQRYNKLWARDDYHAIQTHARLTPCALNSIRPKTPFGPQSAGRLRSSRTPDQGPRLTRPENVDRCRPNPRACPT